MSKWHRDAIKSAFKIERAFKGSKVFSAHLNFPELSKQVNLYVIR